MRNLSIDLPVLDFFVSMNPTSLEKPLQDDKIVILLKYFYPCFARQQVELSGKLSPVLALRVRQISDVATLDRSGVSQ